MNTADLRNLDVAELNARVDDLRSRLATVRRDVSVGKQKNHQLLRQLRRDIAQVLTVRREQSLQES